MTTLTETKNYQNIIILLYCSVAHYILPNCVYGDSAQQGETGNTESVGPSTRGARVRSEIFLPFFHVHHGVNDLLFLRQQPESFFPPEVRFATTL